MRMSTPFNLNCKKVIYDKFEIPCKHSGRVGLLSVEVTGKELLAFSCSKCRDIKLVDLQTTNVMMAYNGEKGMMCKGEENSLFVEASYDQVLELDCTHPVLRKRKTINTTISGYLKGMCYVPSPYRSLVASNGQEVVSVACDNNAVTWRRKQGSFYSEPHGLFYSKMHQAILLADGSLGRILVLDPRTGTVSQAIKLSGMGDRELCLSDDQLIVRHNISLRKHISFYSVN